MYAAALKNIYDDVVAKYDPKQGYQVGNKQSTINACHDLVLYIWTLRTLTLEPSFARMPLYRTTYPHQHNSSM